MNQAQQPEALRLAERVERRHTVLAWAEHDAIAAELRRLHARVQELGRLVQDAAEALQFVERWAVHHGSKPSMTAVEALSCIQHYPVIRAITDSYADGKRPETFDPFARIAELEAREPVYTWTGTEADDAMILLGRMDDSLDRERIDQLEKIIPRLAARITAAEKERKPARDAAAVRTLEGKGFTWRGGEQWAPPIGKAPDFDLIDSLRSKVAGLEAQLAKFLADDERDYSDEDAAIAAGKVQAAVQGRVG